MTQMFIRRGIINHRIMEGVDLAILGPFYEGDYLEIEFAAAPSWEPIYRQRVDVYEGNL